MKTEKEWDAVLKGVASGLTQRDAAEAVGIGESTLYEKMQKDPEFSEAIKKANVQFKLTHITRVSTASKKDWKASAWLLERKFKKEFGRHLEIGADPESPAFGQPDFSKLSVDELEMFITLSEKLNARKEGTDNSHDAGDTEQGES